MTVQRYMLDTNMASYIIRGPTSALAARLIEIAMAQLCISSITQGELLYGLARKPNGNNLQTAVREFLMRIDVLPWDSAAATRYSILRAALEFRGMPLGNLDTLIAAHALAADAILVTHDQAFARVPALVVESWVLQ